MTHNCPATNIELNSLDQDWDDIAKELQKAVNLGIRSSISNNLQWVFSWKFAAYFQNTFS